MISMRSLQICKIIFVYLLIKYFSSKMWWNVMHAEPIEQFESPSCSFMQHWMLLMPINATVVSVRTASNGLPCVFMSFHNTNQGLCVGKSCSVPYLWYNELDGNISCSLMLACIFTSMYIAIGLAIITTIILKKNWYDKLEND